MKSSPTIRQTLVIYFCFFGALLLLLFGATQFGLFKYSLRTLSEARLKLALDLKKRQLSNFFRSAQTQAQTYAQLIAQSSNQRPEQICKNLKNSALVFDPFTSWTIVDAQTKKLLCYNPSRDFSEIATVHKLNQMGQIAYQSQFSDLYWQDQKVVGIITAPILKKGRAEMVLVGTFSGELINKIMVGNRQWQAEGFGQTGETYVVGQDKLMRSDSRFITEDTGTLFLSPHFNLLPQMHLEQIKTLQTTRLLFKADTLAVQKALLGFEDTQIIYDYRGIKVLSAFSSLNLLGIKWAILSELDESEIYAPLNSFKKNVLYVFLVGILLSVIFAFWFSGFVSRPIKSLVKYSEKIGHEQFDLPAPNIRSIKELIDLKTSLAEMSLQLKSKKNEISRALKERIALEEKLVSISDQEKSRMGSELHDTLAQDLVGISFLLSSETSNPNIERIKSHLKNTIFMCRSLAKGLYPVTLQNQGLHHATVELCKESQKLYGKKIEVLTLNNAFEISAPSALHCFRIIQESINNSLKHSNCNHIKVIFDYKSDQVWQITIQDDGIGFNPSQTNGGLGQYLMKARAELIGAQIKVNSSQESGTKVQLCKNEPKN